MSHRTRSRSSVEAKSTSFVPYSVSGEKVEDDDLIPCAVYYRCSSPQQELSVADQRREVEPYCAKKGYRIVRVYTDEGRSASKEPQKRVAFNAMIADAAKGEWKVVVCYDAARFTRFDNHEKFNPKGVLRDYGIYMDTVKEGEFDWNKPEGRWKDTAYCEGNKAAALNLSRDSLRGRVNVCELGFWPCGVVPYGYDKLYTDGIHKVEVKRDEKYAKGRNWHLRLIVNEGEAKAICIIFDKFVNEVWSRRQIALHLNELGIPGPQKTGGGGAGLWDAKSVLTVLTEPAYITVANIGRGRSNRVAHNRVKLTEKPGACPRIVDDPVFHAAQEELKTRSEKRTKPQTARCGVLSGFLFCGRCGYRLCKKARPGSKVCYVCESNARRPHLGCRVWSIQEDEIMPRAMKWLVEMVDEEVIQKLRAQPPEANGRSAEETILSEQVKALEVKVSRGQESALLAPPEIRETAWKTVAGWIEELNRAKEQLALVQAVRNDPAFTDFAAWWPTVKDQLVWIDTTEYEKAKGFVPGGVDPRLNGLVDPSIGVPSPNAIITPVDRDRLRALLGKLGFACRVWWEPAAKEERTHCNQRYKITSVQIEGSVNLRSLNVIGEHNNTSTRGSSRDRG